MELAPSVLEKPSSVVVTEVSGLETPTYFMNGGQGLLDIAVASIATDSMRDKIKEIDAKPIMDEHYYQPFEKSFAAKSLKVANVKTPLPRDQLQPAPKDEPQYAPYDFRFLKEQHGVDYALVVDPHIFGVERSYYGFIPTSAPTGLASLSIYLINLNDNSLAGHYKASVNQPIVGDWDTPPHYTALITAAKKALAKALRDAHLHFFMPSMK